MKIKEVMTQPVVTCPASAMLDNAARLMWEFDCGVVPVIDEHGRLTGVVTDRDICMAAYTQGKPLHAITVTSAMARDVVTVNAGESVETAEHLMSERQVRRLPVLDGDSQIAGIVSMNDLAQLAARSKRATVDRELVSTLAAVCRPRPHAVARPVEQHMILSH
jgi:CBS domain-containing protein